MFKRILYRLLSVVYEFLSKNSIYRYHFHRLGKDSFFHNTHKIVNSQYISIGDNVTIEKDAWLNVILNGNNHGFIEVQNNANLGMRTTLSSANKITIEKHVLLGLNVYIADHQHAYEDTHKPVIYQGTKGIGTVTIKEGAWIGNNVVILASKDLTIGKNSVIGANSVVKESVPDFAVVVGNPSRIVKIYKKTKNKWVRVSI